MGRVAGGATWVFEPPVSAHVMAPQLSARAARETAQLNTVRGALVPFQVNAEVRRLGNGIVTLSAVEQLVGARVRQAVGTRCPHWRGGQPLCHVCGGGGAEVAQGGRKGAAQIQCGIVKLGAPRIVTSGWAGAGAHNR
jgi:hypothetical protein